MMSYVIHKAVTRQGTAPNLADYGESRRVFSWQQARDALDGLPGGGLNIAHEAVDRHARGGDAGKVAIRWLDRNGEAHDYSYADLATLTNRFASVLAGLGVGRGDTVFGLCGRIPELYVAVLGTLKNGSVFCPLFSAFGPEPIRSRMHIGKARVLVTTAPLYRRKVAQLREALPDLEHVLVAGLNADEPAPAGTQNLAALMAAASPDAVMAETAPADFALLHFTSGTTGRPKGAVHVHEAVVSHYASARFALDLHPQDIYWCTADPGWVTGTSYGIIAPLVIGATMVVDSGEFDAERWYRILEQQRVSVWYTAPTAIRMMMKQGSELVARYRHDKLRFMASVGEPLNSEAVVWSRQVFGIPFHDNWWQTETGAIMIANYSSMDVKPGSMGRPMPGVEAAIVRPDGNDLVFVEAAGEQGQLVLRKGWPSMFRGYLGEADRYQKCFSGDWYLTGDLVRRDEDGYFWFVGRADDVIKTAGHLVGPFEVEDVLMQHPAVAEVGVIGKPDPVAMEVVKAFVALKPGYRPDEALRKALLAHARKQLGPAVAPREIEFHDDLPKTRSGKIMRRLLKARELGLPEGDISTLETNR